jgi:glycosyltransferase involved in cell wall biosynthesis
LGVAEARDTVPRVSVVVPTRGRGELLRNCIRSLLTQDYPTERFEIIVVEDGTSEGEKIVSEVAAKSPVPVVYVRIPHSGLAVARNMGAERSAGEIVAYIDDDALAVPCWLSRLVEALSIDGAGGAGGRVSPDYPDDSLVSEIEEDGRMKSSGNSSSLPGIHEVAFVPGGNMAFWRRCLTEVKGFDGAYTKRGCWREETDLCVRLRSKGYRIFYSSAAEIAHRAARWENPLERINPSRISGMIEDDAYFRVKNFGWAGLGGAFRNSIRESIIRLQLSALHLLLAFVHLTAWIPGAIRGLSRKDRQLGTLKAE